jgi:TolB-like protein
VRVLFAQCPDGTPPPCAGQRAPGPARNSIAVLYFENLSRDSGDTYIADGLTEELTARLGQVARLVVASRTATRRLRGVTSLSTAALGRQLNAAYLVNGSVRHEGSRLRVTAELVRAGSGRLVWSQQFDRTPSDLLAVQEEIAVAVARGVTGQVLPAERSRLAARPTRDPTAYDLYLRGRAAAALTTEPGLRRAIDLYRGALAIDSTFAQAWAGIAAAWNLLSDAYVAPLVAEREVQDAAARALALDSGLADAWAAHGYALAILDYDFPTALRETRRAIALDPKSPDAGFAFAQLACMLPSGKAEGLAAIERVIADDPAAPLPVFQRSVCLYYLRRYDDAIAEGRRLQALDSTFFYGDAFDAASWREKGQFDSAVAIYRRVQRFTPLPIMGLAITLARMGRTDEARRMLADFEAEAQRHYFSPTVLAAVHVALGETDAAFADLERGFAGHDGVLWMLPDAPEFEPLHGDPRYHDLLRRMHLEP